MRRIPVLLTALLVLGTASGCGMPPAQGRAARTTIEPSLEAPAPDGVEQALLREITSAPSYRESMEARVITLPQERLQGERGGHVLAVVRITRDGAPVDLSFVRRTKRLSGVAFGAGNGRARALYDRLDAGAGEEALRLVDALANKVAE